MRIFRSLTLIVGIMLVAALVVGCASAKPLSDERTAELTPIAEQMVKDFAAGKTADVYARFDDVTKKAMPEEKIAESWNKMSEQSGAFNDIDSSSSYSYKGYDTVEVVAACEKKNIVFRFVFNKDTVVSGFWANFAK